MLSWVFKFSRNWCYFIFYQICVIAQLYFHSYDKLHSGYLICLTLYLSLHMMCDNHVICNWCEIMFKVNIINNPFLFLKVKRTIITIVPNWNYFCCVDWVWKSSTCICYYLNYSSFCSTVYQFFLHQKTVIYCAILDKKSSDIG